MYVLFNELAELVRETEFLLEKVRLHEKHKKENKFKTKQFPFSQILFSCTLYMDIYLYKVYKNSQCR